MNKTVTSKEAILEASKKIIEENGIQALNMRIVAEKCSVAVGSVYNYFPSKGDLIISSIQSVWMEIMHGYQCSTTDGFAENIQQLFMRVQAGSKKYPSFFSVHSMSVASQDKSKAKSVMQGYLSHIKAGLIAALEADEKVREDAFDSQMSKEEFAGFVFSNIMSLLINGDSSCRVLTEVIKRTIY